jgi:hypothetical protein
MWVPHMVPLADLINHSLTNQNVSKYTFDDVTQAFNVHVKQPYEEGEQVRTKAFGASSWLQLPLTHYHRFMGTHISRGHLSSWSERWRVAHVGRCTLPTAQTPTLS